MVTTTASGIAQKGLWRLLIDPPVNWGTWHTETTLPIDAVEEITAVRCVLLEIAKSVRKIPEQWLQLAKLCRKSNLSFRAEMSCTRAQKQSQNQKEMNFACFLERSTLEFAQKKSGKALSFLSITKERNTNAESSGRIRDITVKWNDRLYLRESLTLMKFSSDAIDVLKMDDLTNSSLAIATVTDDRIAFYINDLEEICPRTGKASRNSNATQFRGTNANPGTITKLWVESFCWRLKKTVTA
jgi:hypothetical protein